VERTLPFRISLDETLDCGEDTGTPVDESYALPFRFSGDLEQVVIELN
jgi:arylsulfatase